MAEERHSYKSFNILILLYLYFNNFIDTDKNTVSVWLLKFVDFNLWRYEAYSINRA